MIIIQSYWYQRTILPEWVTIISPPLLYTYQFSKLKLLHLAISYVIPASVTYMYNQVQVFQINYVPGQLVSTQIIANYMSIASCYKITTNSTDSTQHIASQIT